MYQPTTVSASAQHLNSNYAQSTLIEHTHTPLSPRSRVLPLSSFPRAAVAGPIVDYNIPKQNLRMSNCGLMESASQAPQLYHAGATSVSPQVLGSSSNISHHFNRSPGLRSLPQEELRSGNTVYVGGPQHPHQQHRTSPITPLTISSLGHMPTTPLSYVSTSGISHQATSGSSSCVKASHLSPGLTSYLRSGQPLTTATSSFPVIPGSRYVMPSTTHYAHTPPYQAAPVRVSPGEFSNSAFDQVATNTSTEYGIVQQQPYVPNSAPMQVQAAPATHASRSYVPIANPLTDYVTSTSAPWIENPVQQQMLSQTQFQQATHDKFKHDQHQYAVEGHGHVTELMEQSVPVGQQTRFHQQKAHGTQSAATEYVHTVSRPSEPRLQSPQIQKYVPSVTYQTFQNSQLPQGEQIVLNPSQRHASVVPNTDAPAVPDYAQLTAVADTYPVQEEVKLPSECFTPIAIGDKLPTAHIDLHGICVNLQEFFEDRCGILFGLVGAFNPVDTKKAVPEILRCMDSFEKQVDFVGCLVVNDPFVVKAWAKKLGITDQFTFVADSDAKFTKALGMAQYLPEEGLGLRSRRFAAVVGPRSRIQWVGFDDDSFAASVLQVVPRFVRTPWKSFLVGIGYEQKPKADIQESTSNVSDAIQSIRMQLAQQGFCSEGDWQLVLSDQIPNVFKPTKENILSGLKWLVEGTQAGDVLCLYFAGRAARVTNPDGTETLGVLPMDRDTSGFISEWDLYDILVSNVPEYCRLTIILDIEGEETVQCPLPYQAPYLHHQDTDFGQYKPVQLMSVSAPNEAWNNRFGESQKPKGEILTISLEGSGRTPSGCLASLMNATIMTQIRERPTESEAPSEEGDQPQIVEIPITFREKMERMTRQLQERGIQKYVTLGSSFPLDLNEDFTLADILPKAPN